MMTYVTFGDEPGARRLGWHSQDHKICTVNKSCNSFDSFIKPVSSRKREVKQVNRSGSRGTQPSGSYESYDNGLTHSRSFGPRGPVASPTFLSLLPKQLKSTNLSFEFSLSRENGVCGIDATLSGLMIYRAFSQGSPASRDNPGLNDETPLGFCEACRQDPPSRQGHGETRRLHLPNHIRHRPPRRYERQHVFGVRHDDVEDVRLLRIEHPLDRRAQVLLIHHALAFHVEGIAHADVVGIICARSSGLPR